MILTGSKESLRIIAGDAVGMASGVSIKENVKHQITRLSDLN